MMITLTNQENAMSTESVKNMSVAELTAAVLSLQAQVAELQQKLNAPKPEVHEMTKDHAIRILTGDLKDKKHKDAAEALGLTYGQVYSCRLEFTFKEVHKQLKSEGFKNPWVK